MFSEAMQSHTNYNHNDTLGVVYLLLQRFISHMLELRETAVNPPVGHLGPVCQHVKLFFEADFFLENYHYLENYI